LPENDAAGSGANMTGSAAILALMIDVARESGEIALKYFKSDPEVWTKDNDSPVTEADLAVDRHIKARLTDPHPDIGWLSEETTDNPDRLERQRVFIVDPIDGTRAYIAGGDDWTVSMALVDGERPIVAVLYRPVTDHMYVAVHGQGATKNDESLKVIDRGQVSGARIAGPQALLKKPPLSEQGLINAGYIRSLALRLARVADGGIDIAAARGRSHDWDLAASDLIVHEAGGLLSNLDGEPLTYNRPDPRHPTLVAAAPILHKSMCSMIGDVVETG